MHARNLVFRKGSTWSSVLALGDGSTFIFTWTRRSRVRIWVALGEIHFLQKRRQQINFHVVEYIKGEKIQMIDFKVESEKK